MTCACVEWHFKIYDRAGKLAVLGTVKAACEHSAKAAALAQFAADNGASHNGYGGCEVTAVRSTRSTENEE